ncbi:hypothetical protein Hanom_Chr06g00503831 [Helianthus anomalus]
MASKTGESSSAQTSSDVLYCKWGTISFKNLLQEYDIKPEWNPVLPSNKDTTFPLKHGKITMFSDFFQILQLPVAGCRLPNFGFFRACLEISFFAFDRRDIGVSCLRGVPASSRDKEWKKEFFYIYASVIPGEMHWRKKGAKEKFKDDGPPADAYRKNALFKRLSQRPSECQVIPEGAHVLAGISLLWRDSRFYPAFQRFDNDEWSLFDFIDPPRHTALRSADRVVGEQEADVLKIHIENYLFPVVPPDATAHVSNPPPSGGSGFLLKRRRRHPG